MKWGATLPLVILVVFVKPASAENSTFFETVKGWIETFAGYASAADSLIDKIGVYDMCDDELCPKNYALIRNESAPAPFGNGCGSYGMAIPPTYLPIVSSCCNDHDICYGTCGRRRQSCDQVFHKCLMNVCNNLEKAVANASMVSSCPVIADAMEGSVRRLGCATYLESQKMGCYCSRKH